MKIIVDEDIPYAELLFRHLGEVQSVSGRKITNAVLTDADALMVRSVTCINSSLLKDSKVNFVGSMTTGTDHVDHSWLEQAGIFFAAATGCNKRAVVEYVFSALLLLAKRDGFTLRDKIVGIIGVGNIGGLLYSMLEAFGVSTMLCDPPLAACGVPSPNDTETWNTLEKVVEEADIITFHTPLKYDGPHATWHIVNEELLSALPNNKILINTSRGAIVDNYALLQALEKGKKINVILDVWEKEPTILLPLLYLVDIGTPHIAGYTIESKTRSTTQVFNAYSAFIGSHEHVEKLETLIPIPRVSYIRLNGSIIDEKTLHVLTSLTRDISIEYMKLRHTALLPGAFDNLRKNYSDHREWSSICVETDNSLTAEILVKLGFPARVN